VRQLRDVLRERRAWLRRARQLGAPTLPDAEARELGRRLEGCMRWDGARATVLDRAGSDIFRAHEAFTGTT
jgi:hypothetical protein